MRFNKPLSLFETRFKFLKRRLVINQKLLFSLLLTTFSANADVQVSNLDDFNFGKYSGFGNLRDNDNICINALPISNYQMTFLGSGAGGAFEVSNGVDTLDYLVRFNDRARRAGGQRVFPGTPVSRNQRASDELACPNGLNANIDIRFRRRDLQSANPGRYVGTLTVTVVPE